MKKIRLSKVSFRYKKASVLDQIDLTLKGDECTAIVGSNGSGKTTLGKLVMGILKPDTGGVFYDDEPIQDKSLSYLGGRIGYLFQNPSQQIFALTVMEELSFASRMNGMSEEVISNRLDEVVTLFHLEEIIDGKCHLLSQGEKQRVALATIFMRRPEYIILDEPTTSLDRVRKEALMSILTDIKSQGVGMLIISHDKTFVDKLSDRTMNMEAL